MTNRPTAALLVSERDPHTWGDDMQLKLREQSQSLLRVRNLLPAPTLSLSASEGVTVADVDRVSSWVSGEGGYAFASTGTARPTWVPNGIGGRPALVFDQTVPQRLTLDHRILTALQGTFVSVAQWTNVNGAGVLYAQTDPTQASRRVTVSRRNSSSPSYAMQVVRFNTAQIDAYSPANDLAANTSYIVAFTATGTAAPRMWRNGQLRTVTQVGGNTPWFGEVTTATRSIVGCSESSSGVSAGMYGAIAEILAWDCILTDSQLQRVFSRLSTKYGIALA